MSDQSRRGRVLLVDDEPIIRRAYVMALEAAGHHVEVAADGVQARDQLARGDVDVVLSDIGMPGMSGLCLLKEIRRRDADLPVILMTGQPGFESAMVALEQRALRYLTKPVELPELLDCVQQALIAGASARVHTEMARARTELESQFESAVDKLWVAVQPIVQWSTRSIHAYECLVRSDEPALSTPPALLRAAEELGRIRSIGRAVRKCAAQALTHPALPLAFVNLHALDLLDEELFAESSPLSLAASRVVLEVTERSSIDCIEDVRGRARALRSRGFRIAIDDLGAGYSGLTSFTTLEPDYVKLDMALIRDVHLQPTQQKLIKSIVGLCAGMGIIVIAEGVESAAERDVLVGLGCDLMQGYLFGRPARTPTQVHW
jgi:EAL domain-containing protein (putative c-di-GMP-specific phosphodiesterase class I)/CheY-like chemotaxis protein